MGTIFIKAQKPQLWRNFLASCLAIAIALPFPATSYGGVGQCVKTASQELLTPHYNNFLSSAVGQQITENTVKLKAYLKHVDANLDSYPGINRIYSALKKTAGWTFENLESTHILIFILFSVIFGADGMYSGDGFLAFLNPESLRTSLTFMAIMFNFDVAVNMLTDSSEKLKLPAWLLIVIAASSTNVPELFTDLTYLQFWMDQVQYAGDWQAIQAILPDGGGFSTLQQGFENIVRNGIEIPSGGPSSVMADAMASAADKLKLASGGVAAASNYVNAAFGVLILLAFKGYKGGINALKDPSNRFAVKFMSLFAISGFALQFGISPLLEGNPNIYFPLLGVWMVTNLGLVIDFMAKYFSKGGKFMNNVRIIKTGITNNLKLMDDLIADLKLQLDAPDLASEVADDIGKQIDELEQIKTGLQQIDEHVEKSDLAKNFWKPKGADPDLLPNKITEINEILSNHRELMTAMAEYVTKVADEEGDEVIEDQLKAMYDSFGIDVVFSELLGETQHRVKSLAFFVLSIAMIAGGAFALKEPLASLEENVEYFQTPTGKTVNTILQSALSSSGEAVTGASFVRAGDDLAAIFTMAFSNLINIFITSGSESAKIITILNHAQTAEGAQDLADAIRNDMIDVVVPEP